MPFEKRSDAARSPRPRLALAVIVLAVVVSVVAIGAVVWDIVDPPVAVGTPASQEGQRVGFSIGAIVRTAILPTAAAGFYARYSDADLVSVYQSARPEAAPERFSELVLEIRRRTGA